MQHLYANGDDVARFLGRSNEPDLIAQATEACYTASEWIAAYVGSDVMAGTVTYTLEGTWAERLTIGERPITDVSAVVLQGVPLDPTDYTWSRRGHLIRAQGWGGRNADVTVTFSYGYAAVPEGLSRVCVTAAARLALNPGQYELEHVDDIAAKSFGAGFTIGELIILDRYRRRTSS